MGNMSVMAGLGSLITSGSIVHNTNNNDMEKDDTYCLRWTRHPDMLVGEVAACVEINFSRKEINFSFSSSVATCVSAILEEASVTTTGNATSETSIGSEHDASV